MAKEVQRIEDNRELEDYYIRTHRESSASNSKLQNYVRKRTKQDSELKEIHYNIEQNDTEEDTPTFKRLIIDGKKYNVRYQPKNDQRNSYTKNNKYRNNTRHTGYNKAQNENSNNRNRHTNIDEKNKTRNKGLTRLCYGCGKSGHFANDPVCEQYGQPRLFALGEPSIDREESDKESENRSPEVNAIEEDPDSSEGTWELTPYEDDYAGRMYNDDNDNMVDFFGCITIQEPTNLHRELGPPVCLEEDYNSELFPTMEIYTDYDKMTTINTESDETTVSKMALRKSSRTMNRPDRGIFKDRRPLTAIVNIHGVDAFVLFDSGCTIEALNPSFARVANIKVHQLMEQHSLQLGTIGSKAKFNYGTYAKTTYDDITDNTYYDIVNIDRYDAIIGTRFMRRHGIQLDFQNDTIKINNKPAPTLSVGEDTAEFNRRMAMRRDPKNREILRKDNNNTRPS
ncbi:hypothetical protein D9757_013576 [Collybiopsis confluens]|uniref:CCHC-type domain-containing protein n=1 Tax=Collybiopsis confluens TaxID=2823264 RepID=A0A8H5GKY5_9AGAR|nr:hypothetical protein D9757_013576 [Collybiopsis confluens]